MPALRQELESLKKRRLYRTLMPVSGLKGSRIRVGSKSYVNFASNNYLGLSGHPAVRSAGARAVREWGAGSGASRLLSGNLGVHENLERELARFKSEEAATVFSSGYLANLGVVTSLMNERDLVLVDRLNHASLVDAARLSKARLRVYPHLDAGALDGLLARAGSFRRRLVLTDAYFSMDGHVAPLDRLLEVCERRDALLMVDEAHSTGVFGPRGRGMTEHFGLSGKIDVVMGTLSKALGSVGGFVAGSKRLREHLVNRCREFIYTTGPGPAASAAALESLRIVRREPALRRKLWENVRFLREGLGAMDLNLLGSQGPIIPILVGDPGKAVALKNRLFREGFYAPAIRPPTVPAGTDRIRLSITAEHTREELARLLKVIGKAKGILL